MRKVDPRTGIALGPDAPRVLQHDGAADGKAQTAAALLPRVGGVHLLKTAEDAFQLVGGNAASMVDDGENHAGDSGPQHDAHRRIRRRKLDRIGEQVGEDLEQAIGVGGNLHLRGVVDELHAGGIGHRLHVFDGLLHDFGQLHGAEGERLASALDSLQVENVVDQAHQAVGVGDGDAQQIGGLFVGLAENAGGEQSQRPADGGERRAQFVTDRGDELVLELVQGIALADVAEAEHRAGKHAPARESA